MAERSVTEESGTEGSMVEVTEADDLAVVSVRGEGVVEVAFGSSRIDGDVMTAGIRPGEWLVIGPAEAVGTVVAALDLSGFAHAVEITHGRVCIRVTGADAPRLLEKVCSLDFADHMTPDGAATSASVAKVTCDVIRADREGARSYLLLADCSYRRYLLGALRDAAVEFRH